MRRDLFFILISYFSGSILYARIFGQLFAHEDITENSKDHNPGTANAFINGGMMCGILTLLCDIFKGAVPVYLYFSGEVTWAAVLVLAAPVIGHMFPVFSRMQGGKGIAVTFGCLLGLLPLYTPLLAFAFFFIFFSVILRITPHFYRTIITYLCTSAALFLLDVPSTIVCGFLLITLMVCLRFALSNEEKERFQIKLLWMH